MEAAFNKSLHDAAKCLFEYTDKHKNKKTYLHQHDVVDDDPASKRQKFSVNKLQRKQISLRRGHCYVNSRYGTCIYIHTYAHLVTQCV